VGSVAPLVSLPHQERDRVLDHAQVLLGVDPGDLLQVQRPGLAHQRADGREAVGQHPQVLVARGLDVAPAGHAEGGDLGVGELLLGQQAEQGDVLGVRPGEAALDQVDAEVVERVGHAHLLVGGQGHPLPLHPVAEGGVVEEDRAVGHVGEAFPAAGTNGRGSTVG
jgi:hypothetical protein